MAMTEEELLQRLQDIVEPAAPGWWPPAPGWWVLALLVLLGLIALVVWLVRRHRANRFRRDGEERLQRIVAEHTHDGDAQKFLENLNALLKQVAITRYGRDRVAHLHGRAWCEFLTNTARQTDFTTAPGLLLNEGLYRPHREIPASDLADLARRWIRGCR